MIYTPFPGTCRHFFLSFGKLSKDSTGWKTMNRSCGVVGSLSGRQRESRLPIVAVPILHRSNLTEVGSRTAPRFTKLSTASACISDCGHSCTKALKSFIANWMDSAGRDPPVVEVEQS